VAVKGRFHQFQVVGGVADFHPVARLQGLAHLAVQGEVEVLDYFAQGDGYRDRVRQDNGAVAQGVGADGQQDEVVQGGVTMGPPADRL